MIIRTDEERRGFLAGVSHPSDSLLLDWTTRIRDGERGAEIDGISRRIIHDFCLRQFLNVPQSPVALAWIGDALSKILDYEDPLDVLGLQPRPKKRPADPQRGWNVACWVAACQKRGYSRARAVQAAAEMFHTDASNVNKMLKTGAPEWMNPEEDVWDEYFKLRSRPLPPPMTGKK